MILRIVLMWKGILPAERTLLVVYPTGTLKKHAKIFDKVRAAMVKIIPPFLLSKWELTPGKTAPSCENGAPRRRNNSVWSRKIFLIRLKWPRHKLTRQDAENKRRESALVLSIWVDKVLHSPTKVPEYPDSAIVSSRAP